MRGALASLALALALVAMPVRADTPPSVWDRAKDPSLAESYRVHVEVLRRLARIERTEIADAQLRTVRAMLERFDAGKSKDARLRFDLANVYFELAEYDKAARLLDATLAEFPDHPGAEDGWLSLAFACGHIGDHDCERRGYVRYLQLETEELKTNGRTLSTPILNLAETEMHLGNLREAIDGYREALRIAQRVPSRDTTPLAVWGLAVALDRSGDRPSAEKEARFAIELQRSMGAQNLLRSHNVFFVPAYELHWYEGLGASAQAKVATTPADTVRLWRAAEQSFTSYVRAAENAQDRWLELAKLRLAGAKAERERAERKYGKRPAREPDDDGPETAP